MTDKLKIITNNVPRDIIYGMDLTEKERKEFDYYSPEELALQSFVRYKGWVYDLGEFVHTERDGELGRWHGRISDSYFSGVLIRYPPGTREKVVCGRFLFLGD